MRRNVLVTAGYLRLGLMSFTPPTRSGTFSVSSAFSSWIFLLGGGDVDTFAGGGVMMLMAGVGFFRSLRDGGFGGSSASPWFLNCEFKVFTVFGLSPFRTSMDIDGFFFSTGSATFATLLGETSARLFDSDDLFSLFSLCWRLGMRWSLLVDGGTSRFSVSLSRSA